MEYICEKRPDPSPQIGTNKDQISNCFDIVCTFPASPSQLEAKESSDFHKWKNKDLSI